VAHIISARHGPKKTTLPVSNGRCRFFAIQTSSDQLASQVFYACFSLLAKLS
jgi:hypothetical protein